MSGEGGSASKPAEGAANTAAPAPGQASAARLARHRKLMGLSGAALPGLQQGAVEKEDRLVDGRLGTTADASAQQSKAPVIVLAELPKAPGAAAGASPRSGKSNGGAGQQKAPNKTLAVNAAPFVLNPSVQDFNPSTSAVGSSGAGAQGPAGQAAGSKKGRDRGKEGGRKAGGGGRGTDSSGQAMLGEGIVQCVLPAGGKGPRAKSRAGDAGHKAAASNEEFQAQSVGQGQPRQRGGRANGADLEAMNPAEGDAAVGAPVAKSKARNAPQSSAEGNADGAIEGGRRRGKGMGRNVADPAGLPEESVAESVVKGSAAARVLGLRWEEIGTEKPESGIEIKNPGLARALQHRTEFTEEALRKWNVLNLTFESYIEVGGKYFKPSTKARESGKREKAGKRDKGDAVVMKDTSVVARGGAKVEGTVGEPGGDSKGKGRKKGGGAWWRVLQDDDPISLEPLNQLRYAPFDLKANEDITVWFDPKMLGNYLVSSASFVHPVSRRELTRDDCQALDQHLATCGLRKIGVTEVFEHKERLNDPEERIAVLREEATAIIEAFFSGNSRRQRGNAAGDRAATRRGDRGGGRGGAVGQVDGRRRNGREAGAERRRGLQDDFEYDNWGFVVDDDEEMARATERGLAAMEIEAFPELEASGYQAPAAEWRPKLASASVSTPAPAAFPTKGMGTVFHVSMAHVAQPKKILTKHLAQLLHPHACAVKWLDGVSALVLVRPDGTTPVSNEVALAQIEKNNTRDLAVVTLEHLATVLQNSPSQQPLVDYKGRPVRRMALPSAGELRFLVAQLHNASLTPVDGDARDHGHDSGDDENRLYENWLQTRWRAGAAAKGGEGKEGDGTSGGACRDGDGGGWTDDAGAFVCCEIGEDEKSRLASMGEDEAWSEKKPGQQYRVPDSWDESWAATALAAPAVEAAAAAGATDAGPPTMDPDFYN